MRSLPPALPGHFLPCLLGAVLVSVSTLPAQNARLVATGGSLGGKIENALTNGGANKAFLHLMSANRGSFALSKIDPGDSRSIRIGFDLVGLLLIGALDSNGAVKFGFPVPNDSNLVGVSLLQQTLTLPGSGRVFHEVSNVAVAPLGKPDTWQASTNKMVSPRTFPTTIPLADGYQLIVGGGKGTIFAPAPWQTTEIWDAQNKRFTAGPKLVAPRALHTQTRLPDGRFLLTGGVDAQNATTNTCEIYDPKTNKSAAAASMGSKRAAHTATLLGDGRVLVTGGISSLADVTTAVTTSYRTCEIYNPKTNSWSGASSMSRPRTTHGSMRIDKDRILFCGGITWRSFFFFRIPSITNRCEVYDERTSRFSSVGSMRSSRALMGLTKLSDGKVLAVAGLGGDITAGGTPITACDRFDPATNSWTSVAAVSGRRASPVTMRLLDGRVVAIGGGSGSLFAPGPIDTCEIYDPAANTWKAMPKLSATRLAPAAIHLSSGAVFVCGGGSGTSATAIDTQELYLR